VGSLEKEEEAYYQYEYGTWRTRSASSRLGSMNECHDGDWTHRTACILTYAGDAPDTCLNYVVLAATLLVALRRARQRTMLARCWWWATGTALVGVGLFQIVLCLLLGCAGISIVWCAVAGWLMNERQEEEEDPVSNDSATAHSPSRGLRPVEDVLLTGVLAVLIYYGGTAPPITTGAHFCALVLGALLSKGNRYMVGSSDVDNVNHGDAALGTTLLASSPSS
jgi:uncharacterized iron-regulated membrane protein